VEVLEAAQLSLILHRPVMLDELGGHHVLDVAPRNGHANGNGRSGPGHTLDPHEWLRDHFVRPENLHLIGNGS
jgi:hypothetical protein